MPVEDVTEAGWNDKVLSQDRVAVDFWAPWCPFCVRLAPVFDKASDEVSDMKFVKVNVQNEQSVASKYGVQGIPAIKFFCHGREVGSVLGFRNFEQLKRDIERVRVEDESCVANSSEMKQ
jgi:thioredoxin 1